MLYNLYNAKIQIIYMDDGLPNYIYLFLIFLQVSIGFMNNIPLVKWVCPDILDETFDTIINCFISPFRLSLD